jgi:hypothetical protein
MKTHSRRNFLASMGSLPFLPGLLSGANFLDRSKRSLILIWMDGGMSHIDTFDGKPEAHRNIRGDLVAKESSLEGVFVSQELPRLSKRMHRMSLVRSLTSPEGNHDRGSCYMLTGRRPNPVLTYPSMGSLLGQGKLLSERPVPPYVAIPDSHYYAGHGFLASAKGPFEIGGKPGTPDFKVKDLEPAPQMKQAMDLLRQVDHLDAGARSDAEVARDRFLSQATYLSLEPEARAMFDLRKEAAPIHQTYGRHFLGQSCLLARRLVEGGVRTVFVRDKGWDHHTGIKQALTYGFPPKLEAMDQAVSALHDDLERKGLLENTVVMVASEFGRTPRINSAGGRDHWSRASSVLLFGAGLRPGTVIGRTDAKGEAPIERPVSPADLFYTLMQALGADLGTTLKTQDGRPIPMIEDNMSLIRELLIS